MTLSVLNVCKKYPRLRGRSKSEGTIAVVDVSFTLEPGKTIGVIGESGSGKSTLGRMVLNLETPTGGEILLDGVNTKKMDAQRVIDFRKAVQPVFQDPRSGLNWKHSIAHIIAEPLMNARYNRKAIAARSLELLDQVRLTPQVLKRKPRELSGGMLQRIAIARALALNPRYLVCDEILSALDVSIQAGVVNLLLDLQRERDLSMLFISHDLEIVRHMSDDVIVLHGGVVVEQGSAVEIYKHPKAEYTKYLLGS
ncbi:peptide/nickel transport system ATP-binding protein [Rhodoglobus vestalii]|uniref:Peptide/nickel transport system ATP-binding protein n=1 Tax=Rhodoglobus vestalii TaxID=193384 RepID=A0A8H2PY01_9MICO|nr:dipeptide/oligopeptide/nickel ABC transporter ATP-binding protein [Rhodoglobus vestalii]TQO19824.1 peptide/nickel transport system ATP-binding protein [Rhodoglobus vestalii]